MKNESKTESISEIRPESKENAAVEFADGIKIIRNIPYTEERETRNATTSICLPKRGQTPKHRRHL